MCATCKTDLKEVNRIDDNYPIVLDKLTFNVFSDYLSTKRSENSGEYLSATSFGGVQISLTHLYRMSVKTMDGGFKKELSQFMSVIKRVVADNKR